MGYPLIVDNAWRVIEKMIKDWQENPYIFLTERDVQAELYRRLYLSMKLIGEETVEGLKYKADGKNVVWNRLTCEPSVNINETGDKTKCIPDLVIWDELDELKKEDDNFKWKTDWPILFAVELKYDFSAYGSQLKSISQMEECYKTKEEKETRDLIKLKALLQKHKSSMYGCTVYLTVATSKDKKHLKVVSAKGINLWQYYACVPVKNDYDL